MRDLLSTKEAAKVLHRKADALKMWRFNGYGPPHFKIGGTVMYDRAELTKWLEAQRREPLKPTPWASKANAKPAPASRRKVASRNRKADAHVAT
jgi:hypothetical protein